MDAIFLYSVVDCMFATFSSSCWERGLLCCFVETQLAKHLARKIIVLHTVFSFKNQLLFSSRVQFEQLNIIVFATAPLLLQTPLAGLQLSGTARIWDYPLGKKSQV
jgi:hypothetical protein